MLMDAQVTATTNKYWIKKKISNLYRGNKEKFVLPYYNAILDCCHIDTQLHLSAPF